MQEDRYRTGAKRFWAAIIDALVVSGPVLLYVFNRFSKHPDRMLDHATELFFINFAWTLVPVLYSVLCHYAFGYTIGKWVTRVQVLDISETRKISFKQAVLRDIVPVTVSGIGALILGMLLLIADDPYTPYQVYYDATSNCISLWTLAEIISMLTNEKRRGVHDFIAKTVVVRMPEDKTRLSKVVYHQ